MTRQSLEEEGVMTTATLDALKAETRAKAEDFLNDAIDDGVHAARRTIKSVKRRLENLGELREEAAHQVKHHPLATAAAALGVGVALGAAAGWAARGCARRG